MILRFNPRRRPEWRALALLLFALLTPQPARAHDIPTRVAAYLFVKPEGRTLRIMLRVPLESMRDITFPLRGPGYLDVARSQPLLKDAVSLWLVDHLVFSENGERLPVARVEATRVSLPTDRSFTGFESAVTHITSEPPLSDTVDVPWRQALLDVALTIPITSDQSHFALEPTLSGLALHTTTVVHFMPSGSSERAFTFDGDPGVVALDPRWYEAAGIFVRRGVEHILGGMDHLLFVICLVIPIRRMRSLIGIITAFTAAHSITLIASAAGLAPDALWFPPLIETLIAVSIVYMAFENMVAKPEALGRRWMVAFAFGLVHGFAFSFALRESMQFAGSHLVAALLSFNVGVELGQLLVVATAIPVLAWMFRSVVAERPGVLLSSALVAHTAWHWMLDRGALLSQYHFVMPAMNLAFAAATVRATMLLIVIGVVAWLMSKGVKAVNADSSTPPFGLRSE